ncbi:GNAT family N-acetyltransferase [Candidatus Dojkabacteria bacterium]|nr:GNAT family N-acetyltransferase [Candidatus Dojkabacteria bacterium]
MIKVVKLQESEISKIIPLWEAQEDFHCKIDSVYYRADPGSVEYLKNAIKTGSPAIFAAKDESDYVGFITISIEKVDYHDTNIDEYGEIIELFVKPDFRGQGIGKILLDNAHAYLAKKNIKWIKLYCSSFNSDALAFYEKLGFTDRQRVLFKPIK